MRFSEYDYQEHVTPGESLEMDAAWHVHWRGRQGLKEDLQDEPLWLTIREYLSAPGRILEAGCGTGQWVQFLGKLGHEVVGVDYAPSGLEVGRAHNPDLCLMQADFRNLPFNDESFDYVVSFGAVEHDLDGPEAALQEFRRVLKPGGKLMCSVPCLNLYRVFAYPWLIVCKWLKRRETLRRLWGKRTPFTFYQYLWSPGAYRAILDRCGFTVLEIRGYGTSLRSPRMRALDLSIGQVFPLSSAHMMMAICRKA